MLLATSNENEAICDDRSMMAIRLVRGRRVTIQVAKSFIRAMRSSFGVFHAEVGELSSTMAIDTGSEVPCIGVVPDA